MVFSTIYRWFTFCVLLAHAAVGTSYALFTDQIDYSKAKRVGIFIGTFDPPHSGHRDVMRSAIRELNLDYLLMVPNATAIHKPGAISFDVRLEMVQELYFDDSVIAVPRSADDLDFLVLRGLSKTIKKANSLIEVVGVVGSDIVEPRFRNTLLRLFSNSYFDRYFVNIRTEEDVALKNQNMVWNKPATYSMAQDTEPKSSTRTKQILAEHPEFYNGSEIPALSTEGGLDPKTQTTIRKYSIYSPNEKKSGLCDFIFSKLRFLK